jgi:CRISPR/Cas system-associated exonuclease Cas4 (RecB family)
MSKLNVYEECPKRAYLAYVEKIPEPNRGSPPLDKYASGEWPHERGERVHKHIENFVRGIDNELLKEVKDFKEHIEILRILFQEGNVELEQMWGITKGWESCGGFSEDTWARLKLDACVVRDKTAIVIDYKTGKRKFNEVKHGEQLIFYVIATFLKYSDIENVVGELWYIDQDSIFQRKYRRQQALNFIRNFNDRALTMTTDQHFIPRPSTWNCRFCPYGRGKINNVDKTGHCEVSQDQ